MDDTIEKNIAFGVEKTDLEKVEKVHQANLANFVETLKMKSQEKLVKKESLSGGQTKISDSKISILRCTNFSIR